MEIAPIAHIHTEFSEKFGIPRQSGLAPSLRGTIEFEKPYRNPDWIKGIEEYSHLWLIFDFSLSHREEFAPMVYPPRLGGKEKKGVFATRTPFRPNSMGLSSVKLEEVIIDERKGPLLVVSGADLLDGTPIYDIKPYLPYADCHADAVGSFGEDKSKEKIKVVFPENVREKLSPETCQKMVEVLEQDPRAAYNKKEDYVYGMSFMDYDIRFRIDDGTLVVLEVVDRGSKAYIPVKGTGNKA